MPENAIFSPRRGGGRTPPLIVSIFRVCWDVDVFDCGRGLAGRFPLTVD